MWAALFLKEFLEVPSHEAVGMAASASAETGLDVDEISNFPPLCIFIIAVFVFGILLVP